MRDTMIPLLFSLFGNEIHIKVTPISHNSSLEEEMLGYSS